VSHRQTASEREREKFKRERADNIDATVIFFTELSSDECTISFRR